MEKDFKNYCLKQFDNLKVNDNINIDNKNYIIIAKTHNKNQYFYTLQNINEREIIAIDFNYFYNNQKKK